MNFFKSFIFSILLHSIFFLYPFYQKKRHNKIKQYKISTISGTLSFSQNQKSKSLEKKSQNTKLKSNLAKNNLVLKNSNNHLLSMKSSIEDEIGKIQNYISYPELALIQGWQSSCEWEVIVGKNQLMKSILLVKPCDYEIFEEEFKRVISEWKFDLPENTVLNVPIEFVIDSE